MVVCHDKDLSTGRQRSQRALWDQRKMVRVNLRDGIVEGSKDVVRQLFGARVD